MKWYGITIKSIKQKSGKLAFSIIFKCLLRIAEKAINLILIIHFITFLIITDLLYTKVQELNEVVWNNN